jgi:hypothetical protein
LEKEERKGENVSAFLELFDDEGNRMTTSSGLNDNMINNQDSDESNQNKVSNPFAN